jgi:hypothetical protein
LENNEVREVEKQEVEKTLSCKKLKRGCFLYFCAVCIKFVIVTFGCNSRLCSCCGKRYSDKWADRLTRKIMPKTEHRHMVFSVPEILWWLVRNNRGLQKVLMDVAAKTIKECFGQVLKKNLDVGIICVLHPFGRDLIFKPHVHAVVTNGGFAKDGKFVKLGFVKYNLLHKKWQYNILMELRGQVSKRVIDYCFNKYPNGFACYLKPEVIWSNRFLSKYIGRYLRHPAIANSRITFYNEEIVRFYYLDHKTKKRIVCELKVFDFVASVVQHIPDKNFKMVRYYGLYSRKGVSKVRKICLQSSLKQKILFGEIEKEVFRCPYCSEKMIFVAYFREPPDDLVLRVEDGRFF